MILEVVSVLRSSIVTFGVAQREIVLLEVVLHDGLSRVPFLTIHLFFDAIGLNKLRICSIAQLEVR